MDEVRNVDVIISGKSSSVLAALILILFCLIFFSLQFINTVIVVCCIRSSVKSEISFTMMSQPLIQLLFSFFFFVPLSASVYLFAVQFRGIGKYSPMCVDVYGEFLLSIFLLLFFFVVYSLDSLVYCTHVPLFECVEQRCMCVPCHVRQILTSIGKRIREK